MAYRFKFNESLTRGVRRIGLSQLELAESRLKEASSPGVAVHEVRKSVKRARALLRLVRPALGEKVYRQANVELRDLGRLLSDTRDKQVLRDTAAKLETLEATDCKPLLMRLRDSLDGQPQKPGAAVDRVTLRQARASLAAAKRRFAGLKASNDGFAPIEAGLRATYRSGRHALAHVLENPDDEAFHELRKCVQQHWRQMLLVSRAWPQICRSRASAAREIAQLLGEEHDYAILAKYALTCNAALSDRERKIIEKACRAKQQALRALAIPKVQRLFAERAGSFARQLATYWSAARELSRLEPEESSRDRGPTAPASRSRKQEAQRP